MIDDPINRLMYLTYRPLLLHMYLAGQQAIAPRIACVVAVVGVVVVGVVVVVVVVVVGVVVVIVVTAVFLIAAGRCALLAIATRLCIDQGQADNTARGRSPCAVRPKHGRVWIV